MLLNNHLTDNASWTRLHNLHVTKCVGIVPFVLDELLPD